MLEIASGTGEHIVGFARRFAALDWQPSDPDAASRASIAGWANDSALANIAAPLAIDASQRNWPIDRADAMLCINMIHISPWPATLGLLGSAARILPAGGPLILYGSFIRGGTETAPSNLAFDRSLRERNADWGLRELGDVLDAAEAAGFSRFQTIEMPANNLSITLRKI